MEHFQRGAEVNYAPSVKALASMYYLGQGQPRDVDKAIATIMPLATGNDPEAMYTIAAMYLGSRNLRAGREWLQKSSAAGNAQATQMLAMLNGRGVRTSGRR